jgi:hypothetical protein
MPCFRLTSSQLGSFSRKYIVTILNPSRENTKPGILATFTKVPVFLMVPGEFFPLWGGLKIYLGELGFPVVFVIFIRG